MTQELKVLTVVGARPQFVKAATVSRALAEAGVDECLVHTGQHYDWEMSQVFFEGLAIPSPEVNLNVGSGRHGEQTGRMLGGLEQVMIERAPGMVMVYGDTNSTMAGALAAAKLHIPIAHVEAGLRSFNRRMPEEINRVVTDHVSDLLFAPTRVAVDNLSAEGISDGVVRTGDVMYDLALQTADQLEAKCDEILGRHRVDAGQYAFVTIHRAENTDDPSRWAAIVEGLRRIADSGTLIVWPAHPRTSDKVAGLGSDHLKIVKPLPYLEAQALIRFARVVITDSGGVQKEAAFRETPCRTVRTETEWIELVECGVNQLVEAEPGRMLAAATTAAWPENGLPESLYGNGHTSEAIAASIRAYLEEN
jgi:UDP-N-acetylglucosamine 2-epimerase